LPRSGRGRDTAAPPVARKGAIVKSLVIAGLPRPCRCWLRNSQMPARLPQGRERIAFDERQGHHPPVVVGTVIAAHWPCRSTRRRKRCPGSAPGSGWARSRYTGTLNHQCSKNQRRIDTVRCSPGGAAGLRQIQQLGCSGCGDSEIVRYQIIGVWPRHSRRFWRTVLDYCGHELRCHGCHRRDLRGGSAGASGIIADRISRCPRGQPSARLPCRHRFHRAGE